MEAGEWPIETVIRMMEAAGYAHDIPREVSPTERYHRFVPPVGSRMPPLGVTAENGRVQRKHVETIRSILEDFKNS